MKETIGNLWDSQAQVICITTNGYVKKNGECVMGRGCAKEAVQRIPALPAVLGAHIKKKGNRVHILASSPTQHIVSFPVKPDYGYELVPHMVGKLNNPPYMGWACKADYSLITASAFQLIELADKHNWIDIALPRPGCGAGELEWKHVKPILLEIFDDRFTCYNFT